MGFNYAREKRRFDIEWLQLAVQYKEAGFDAAGIQAMRNFDWELFCKRRTYENSVQAFPSESIDENNNESKSALFQKFNSLTVSFDENSLTGRYDWIQSISDPVLADKLAMLSDDDKELLTLFAFDDYTQAEIAEIQGCSQQAVSKKLKRIKIFLK